MKQSPQTNFLGPDQKLLVIIGPSGSGKSQLLRTLAEQDVLELTPSWTTRPRRTKDEETLDHVFVSEHEFRELQDRNFFLETVTLFNMPFVYGLPRVAHTHETAVPTIILRSMILPLVYRHYNSVIVYQIEAPKTTAEERIRTRGGTDTDAQKRLAIYDQELQQGRKIADRIFVNDKNLHDLVKAVTRALREDFPELS